MITHLIFFFAVIHYTVLLAKEKCLLEIA